MTVSSTTRKAGPFLGNGSAATFAFAFTVFSAADLLVVQADSSSGVETALDLDSDYSVTLNGDQDNNPGGSITLLAGPLATGQTLVITTAIGALQAVSLANQAGFYPDVLNKVHDLLTVLVQQLKQQADASLRFPVSDPYGLNAELPPVSQRAGKVLYFGADGSPTLVGTSPPGTLLFSGTPAEAPDGARTVFTLRNGSTPIGKTPLQETVWWNYPLARGEGYTLGPAPGQVTILLAAGQQPPAADDKIFIQGVF